MCYIYIYIYIVLVGPKKVLHCHLLIHAEIYIYMLDTYRRNDKDAGRTSWQIYLPLTLVIRVRKGCVGFYCKRELETEQKLKYFDPQTYGRHVVSFLFSWCWGPLCWMLASFTASYQHLLWTAIHQGFPRAPSAWCGFPYHISSPIACNSPGSSNSTALYNRSTPTRSLKSNV